MTTPPVSYHGTVSDYGGGCPLPISCPSRAHPVCILVDRLSEDSMALCLTMVADAPCGSRVHPVCMLSGGHAVRQMPLLHESDEMPPASSVASNGNTAPDNGDSFPREVLDSDGTGPASDEEHRHVRVHEVDVDSNTVHFVSGPTNDRDSRLGRTRFRRTRDRTYDYGGAGISGGDSANARQDNGTSTRNNSNAAANDYGHIPRRAQMLPTTPPTYGMSSRENCNCIYTRERVPRTHCMNCTSEVVS